MDALVIDKSKTWTVSDYLNLNENDIKSEIINAELIMTPAPAIYHQKILREVFLQLNEFIKKYNLGEILFSPVDVFFDQINVFQPDIVFIEKQNLKIIKEHGIEGAPDLVVEVISPTNSYIDRYSKKAKYEEFGVKEYWIVDPGNKTLEIFVLKEGVYELFLFLAEDGKVFSKLLKEVNFELFNIW